MRFLLRQFFFGIVALCGVIGGALAQGADYAKRLPIHVAWPPTAAPVNQFGQALQRTNIAELWGLDLKITPFTSAAEMISALASGAVDVYWASDGPVGGAIARGVPLKVVAENAGWGQGIAVRKDSPIKSLADLKGKKVGVHEGTTTAQYARDMVQKSGVDPKDVTWVNVPIGEQASVFAAGAVDAVMAWSPVLYLLPDARYLYEEPVGIGKQFPGTFIAVKTETAEKQREAIVRFLAALLHANLWSVQNADQVNAWYGKDVKLDLAILARMLSAEPLWQVKAAKDIDYRVSPAHIAQMSKTANAFAANARLSTTVDFAKHVDNSIVEEAQRRAYERVPTLTVKVTRP